MYVEKLLEAEPKINPKPAVPYKLKFSNFSKEPTKYLFIPIDNWRNRISDWFVKEMVWGCVAGDFALAIRVLSYLPLP